MRSFGLNTWFSHFSFSHFPTEKLENEKIRTNFLIFSFSHFPIYPWTNEKMRKLENEKIQHDFRIFAFPIFEWKNEKNQISDLRFSTYRTKPQVLSLCHIYFIFRCLLNLTTLPISTKTLWSEVSHFPIFPYSYFSMGK